ncbi:MAG: hypothetical protein AB7G44_14910, partial [Bacteroidia bacterium]
MRNKEQWKPSKFVYRNGKLYASRDAAEVNVSSRLIADIIASFYEREIKNHVKGKLLDLGCGKVPLYLAYLDFTTEVACVDWPNSLHKNIYLDHEMDLNM